MRAAFPTSEVRNIDPVGKIGPSPCTPQSRFVNLLLLGNISLSDVHIVEFGEEANHVKSYPVQ